MWSCSQLVLVTRLPRARLTWLAVSLLLVQLSRMISLMRHGDRYGKTIMRGCGGEKRKRRRSRTGSGGERDWPRGLTSVSGGLKSRRGREEAVVSQQQVGLRGRTWCRRD